MTVEEKIIAAQRRTGDRWRHFGDRGQMETLPGDTSDLNQPEHGLTNSILSDNNYTYKRI